MNNCKTANTSGICTACNGIMHLNKNTCYSMKKIGNMYVTDFYGGPYNWSDADTYCRSRGLRLPSQGGAVSICASDFRSSGIMLWTSLTNGPSYGHVYINSLSGDGCQPRNVLDDNSAGDFFPHSVRCVK